MSNLLIEDKPLLVLPVLACECGLNEAMFLQQLHYWIQRSENVRDGYTWVYNSYVNWQKQFPFWSISTLKRLVWKLEEEGYIISANYNRLKLDKTKWYRINYEKLAHLSESYRQTEQADYSHLNSQHSMSEPLEGSDLTTLQSEVNRPIPESTTDTNSESTAENAAASHSFVKEIGKEQSSADDVLASVRRMEIELIAQRFMELRKSGSKLKQSDYNGITEVLDTGIAREDALRWMEECFQHYRPRHHRDKINSFLYCVPYILERHAERFRASIRRQVRGKYNKEDFDLSELPSKYNEENFDLDD
ncbi:replication protein [Priestia taiwanensis]|uniref:Replication protein n=1 Tax=Priestia taiwanensis TaxID=1347902 RepID=A0A917AW67_9BACI|nr:replication protein [Priestia taiwanensis]MBM7364788.1 hypothetical protein [Priestia taiwanensis]GGE79650.1 hypothetical protein GCM10007140_31530 [Priestia taiwanensis]